jgi:hypothetical protein
MHKLVQGIGGALALIGLLVIGYAFSTQSGAPAGMAKLYLILIGLSVVLPGAMIFCLGAIVEHLIAIRRNTERQLAIFEKLGQPKL